MGGGFLYFIVCLIFPPPGRPYTKVLLGNDLIEGQVSPPMYTGSEDDTREEVNFESKNM
jgi:hypothetical protein